MCLNTEKQHKTKHTLQRCATPRCYGRWSPWFHHQTRWWWSCWGDAGNAESQGCDRHLHIIQSSAIPVHFTASSTQGGAQTVRTLRKHVHDTRRTEALAKQENCRKEEKEMTLFPKQTWEGSWARVSGQPQQSVQFKGLICDAKSDWLLDWLIAWLIDWLIILDICLWLMVLCNKSCQKEWKLRAYQAYWWCGFFLTCKDLGRMFDHSLPTCTFFFFEWRLAHAH